MKSYLVSAYAVTVMGLGAPVMAWAQVVVPPPQSAVAIKRIVVSVTRTPESSFNVPGSVYTVTRRQISEAEPEENLSESLNRVPGIDIQNRQNYAEGLRVTSRGFGSQTSFGVRNVKIFVDGMPLTTPDGTTDSSVIDLGDVSRIEVLSGPFSALYGNAAGGVLQVFSRSGPKQATAEAGFWGGSFGAFRVSASYGGQASFGRDGNFNYMMNASDFYTGGYRNHSSARRQQFYGKYRIQTDANTDWTLLIDAVNEPYSQDPLGLTAAQYHANPRQAGNGALKFDTSKVFRHVQAGIVLNHRFNDNNSLRVLVYDGSHDVLQYLPFTGNFAQSGGGVIDLNRKFGGVDTRFTHEAQIDGMKLTTVAGVDYGYEHQHRKGYVNNFGAIGALRRNENDVAQNVAEYAQAELKPDARWSFDAGIRHSDLNFSVQDLYVTPKLPSDTGSVSYGHTSLVAGTVYHLTALTNLYADYGQGFETPTLDQLAYLPNGNAGLNAALKPTTSENYETGIKSFLTQNTYLKIALFHIHTSNQIVVARSTGGRTSYANEGQTARNGVDASIDSALPHHIELYAAYSYIDARFRQSAVAGKFLPGVPSSRIYGEADWRDPASGFYTRLDAQWETRLYVDNQNSAYAPGYFRADWAGGFRQAIGPLGFDEFLRVNNIFNRSYIGSVIIGDTNAQYYEPAPTRNFIVGVSARYRF